MSKYNVFIRQISVMLICLIEYVIHQQYKGGMTMSFEYGWREIMEEELKQDRLQEQQEKERGESDEKK